MLKWLYNLWYKLFPFGLCEEEEDVYALDLDGIEDEIDYEFWLVQNEEKLQIQFAETGQEQELDFDFDQAAIRIYESTH